MAFINKLSEKHGGPNFLLCLQDADYFPRPRAHVFCLLNMLNTVFTVFNKFIFLKCLNVKYILRIWVLRALGDVDVYLCIPGRWPRGDCRPLRARLRVQLPAPRKTHGFLSFLLGLSGVFTFSIHPFSRFLSSPVMSKTFCSPLWLQFKNPQTCPCRPMC